MSEANEDVSLAINTSSYDNEKTMLEQIIQQHNSIGQTLNELKSVEQNERKRKRADSESEDTKNVNIIIPRASEEQIVTTTQHHSKTFILKHTFKNVSFLLEDGRDIAEVEEHFGIPWRTYIFRKNNLFAVFVNCPRPLNTPDWCIKLEHKLAVIGKNNATKRLLLKEPIEFGVKSMRRCHGTNFMDWQELENHFLDGDKITVEAHITILKMTGIYKKNLRFFDESARDISDIVLVVDGERFHVAKLLLASHSSYFKTLFLGPFGESMQSEIALTGIDADDFQNYLEVLYGESAIDDFTLEGILLVADMYDTGMVARKCEEFLTEKSKKVLKMRLSLAVRYRLDNLKKHCLSQIRTPHDIRKMLPSNLKDMDHGLMTDLFEKLLAMK